MAIKDIFLKLTSTTSPHGHEKLMEQFLPDGWKKDAHGNYYYKIGESSAMFSCHLDTADQGQPKRITHEFVGDIIKTDGKTILGADDKAGVAIMIVMINKKIPGLYYFFLGEERGRIGSKALAESLKKDKDNPIFKNINKVIAFDRANDDNLITHQMSERCCSDDFADDLISKMKEAGITYKKDPSGSYTDSYSFREIFSECTNLSVGYEYQHATRETQDIAVLQKLADAVLKINWDSIVAKRDQTKTEYNSRGNYTRSNYNTGRYSNYDNDDWYSGSGGGSSTTNAYYNRSSESDTGEYVKDYLGNKVKKSESIWCEHDKAWCLKKDAIWVDYVGFYTTPDYDPSKVVKEEEISGSDFKKIELDDIKVGQELYLRKEFFGKVLQTQNVDGKVHVSSGDSKAVFMLPIDKLLNMSLETKNKNSSSGNGRLLEEKDLAKGLVVYHPIFGKGNITSIRTDRNIVSVDFKNSGEKFIRLDVAGMTF